MKTTKTFLYVKSNVYNMILAEQDSLQEVAAAAAISDLLTGCYSSWDNLINLLLHRDLFQTDLILKV